MGIPWFCRFAFVQCGNPAGLGLKSQESRGDGINWLRESRGVGCGLRDVVAVGPARYLLTCSLTYYLLESVWRDVAEVARGLLVVPATSTSSERSFSLAGRTLEER